jgi:hypothetical protein
MKNHFYLLIIICTLISCRQSKDKPKVDDLVTVNDKGAQEVKVEELSVEDVNRLMNSSDVAAQSYTAILVNELEKVYYFNADTQQTVKFVLNTKSENVGMTLYKEVMKSVKKDSVTSIRIKDFAKICEGDSCSEKSKKATRYKALVKLKRKFESKDSTAEFSLNIFKN